MFESTPATEEFSGCIVRRDVEGMRRMVANGFDINNEIRQALAALDLAVTSSTVEMCAAVISLGADVNLQFPSQVAGRAARFSALHHAANQHSYAKVELLLAAGANPNAKSIYGANPVHLLLQESASSADWLKSLHALLAAGSDPNAVVTRPVMTKMQIQFDKFFGIEAGQSGSVLTTLHCAVLISHFIDQHTPVAARLQGSHGARVIEMLLRYGADPCFMPADPPKHYLTPLQMAVKFGSAEDVQVMVESGRANMLQKTVTGRSLRQLTCRPQIHEILRSDHSAGLVSNALPGSDLTVSVPLRAGRAQSEPI